jgi:DNA-directed RNA polymerase subunit RPC12/RpoP
MICNKCNKEMVLHSIKSTKQKSTLFACPYCGKQVLYPPNDGVVSKHSIYDLELFLKSEEPDTEILKGIKEWLNKTH